jgi:uncharacterized cupredoxin-like copper-binding protein
MKPLIVCASLLTFGTLVASACGGGEASTLQTIEIHYSKFVPTELTVPAGKPVTLTLRNEDPIAHEWIVGTEDIHARHRTGTEPYHDEIPTEVTVRAYESKQTTITFDEPGEYLYICHLPGHESYGMVGTLHVVE